MDSLRARLEALYRDADGPPLRVTDAGLWHPTPLDVLAAAVPVLERAGLFFPGATVFDAGAGDGRVLAALALGLSAWPGVRLAGLESDADLADEAARRLGALAPRPLVAAGDYLRADDYLRVSVAPAELDVALNYPDGNERALLRWLREQAPRCALVVLSAETDPDLGAPPRLRLEVPRADAPPWHVSVFVPEGEAPARPAPG